MQATSRMLPPNITIYCLYIYDLPYSRWNATMRKQIQNFESKMTRYGNLIFQISGQLHIPFCKKCTLKYH